MMPQPSPSVRSPWLGLLRLSVLLAGIAVLSASPRMAHAGDDLGLGLTQVQRRAGGPPEVVQPGDDDQPTISGKKRRAVTVAAPEPATAGSPHRQPSGTGAKPGEQPSLVLRWLQFLRGGWWVTVR